MMQQKREHRSDPRLKPCPFCPRKLNPKAKSGSPVDAVTSEVPYLDYKDYPTLRPYIDYFGNIRQRYYTGVCLKHQKMLKGAVELARFMGMIAYRK